MIPKSFSATSLQVAEGCLSRYKAQVIDRGAQFQGDAANVGLVCHDTLEHLVKGVFIKRDLAWEWEVCERLFHEAFHRVIGPNESVPEYGDALSLVRKWFFADNRYEDLAAVTVLSVESKNNFEIPAGVDDGTGVLREHKFPVNYIMDRVERIGPGEYKVVDYKSNWVPLNFHQLKDKIQARLYALALQIVYRDAQRIWVEFDFLRHEAVSVVFTRQDNADTWRMLKRAVQRVVDTSDADAEKSETLNMECGWCVKKATCKTMNSNVAVGGLLSLGPGAAAVRFGEIGAQIKALKQLESELGDYLLKALMTAGTIDLDLDEARIQFKRSSRRQIDNREVAEILGPELSAEIGSFTLGNLDELRKGGRLTMEQKIRLDAATSVKMGDAKIAVTVKK